MQANPHQKIPTLLTVKNFAKKHKDFISEPGLRFQIFNRKSNGLEEAGAIIKLGDKVLVDEERYFGVWVEPQRCGGKKETAVCA
tara:strand:- start:287 stop:538 length:252 start_codon:yes stop_codon:yes gene_type:complete